VCVRVYTCICIRARARARAHTHITYLHGRTDARTHSHTGTYLSCKADYISFRKMHDQASNVRRFMRQLHEDLLETPQVWLYVYFYRHTHTLKDTHTRPPTHSLTHSRTDIYIYVYIYIYIYYIPRVEVSVQVTNLDLGLIWPGQPGRVGCVEGVWSLFSIPRMLI
jgi:hypothetical protein